VAEPLTPVVERHDVAAFFRGTVPRTYLLLGEDRSLPLDNWRLMAERLGVEVEVLPGLCHLAMLVEPDAVARPLLELAR
jgi:pimeloyl-ACP methyl ester carboxylesterase